MAQILTFLGKGGTGRTTVAIAVAHAIAQELAQQDQRVLLMVQDTGPAPGLRLGMTLSATPQPLAVGLDVVQLQSAPLLERGWERLKQLEQQYVRTPFLSGVYGEELGILPGMDSGIALYGLWDYARSAPDRSRDSAGAGYDVIVLDGLAGLDTLRTLGTLEVGSWYWRRFRQVWAESELGKTLAPFLPPLLGAVLDLSRSGSNWSGGSWNGSSEWLKPLNEANELLDDGRAAIADPNRVLAYLVTSTDPSAIAMARYLWGSAQQINLTVAGVIQTPLALPLSPPGASSSLAESFAPLPVRQVGVDQGDWLGLGHGLIQPSDGAQAPRPLQIDASRREVRAFLPGFDKRQVRLTQYGPELTIEAGDQRRNIILPENLRGLTVQGAKFQGGYLIIQL